MNTLLDPPYTFSLHSTLVYKYNKAMIVFKSRKENSGPLLKISWRSGSLGCEKAGNIQSKPD